MNTPLLIFMKNLKLALPTSALRLFTYALLSTCTVLALSSCKKTDDTVKDQSYLRVINVSPTAGTYNAYINDKLANSAALPFGGTINYVQAVPGTYSLKFTTASDIQSLLTRSVTLETNKVYSYYLIEKVPNLDGLLVVDDMSMAAVDKGFVKFINLSADAPALDLVIKDGASVTTGKTYKTSSAFTGFEPKAYTFQIKDSATGTVKATLSDVTLAAGRFYTIVAKGLLNPGNNEQAFGAQSIINQ